MAGSVSGSPSPTASAAEGSRSSLPFEPPSRRFSFVKKLNVFGFSSSSSVARKIERRETVDNSECRTGDVKSLKQFWTNHILNVQNATVKQKSSTLSYRAVPAWQSEDRELSQSSPSLATPEPPESRLARTVSSESVLGTGKSESLVDNFDKYKTAETVKSRRRSREEAHFPLVASTGGTKIHWAKRDEILRGQVKPRSQSMDAAKFKIYEDRRDALMVSDMVDMVMEPDPQVSRPQETEEKEPEGSKKAPRKISFRTKTPTNSFNRRVKADNSSKVAALTLRFNQLVLQDQKLLHEVQKNGGLVHKVGNHVYKIVEEDPKKKKDDDSSSVSSRVSGSKKKNSVRRKASMKAPKPKEQSVKDLKDLFENQSPPLPKPKVPDKSETVLQRSTELRKLKSQLPEERPREHHFIKKEPDHKSKYSRMYEKLRFRSLFAASRRSGSSSSKEDSPSPPQSPVEAPKLVRQNAATEEPQPSFIHALKKASDPLEAPETPDSPESPEDGESEHRILEAISTIDTRIESLQRAKETFQPNQSFLFSTLPKSTSTCDVQSSLVVAINEALSKTQSMDESLFPHDSSNNNKLLSTIRGAQRSTEALNEASGYEYIHKPEEVYQTLAETFSEKRDSVNSYESFEQYESLEDFHKGGGDDKEYGYEICDPPPEPPPPRKPTEPALPVPKRNLPEPSITYERIQYTDTPPRPPKEHLDVPLPPPRNEEPAPETPEDENGEYYEENIYDTIKNGDSQSLLSSCYEAIQQRNKINGENLIYESLISKTEFQRFHSLQHADSILTLASDQKTNSIYGATIGHRNSLPSERGSEGSDEWIDMSDDEEKHKFIVIREKQKVHRSPEWSRKVRDQHNHQRQTSSDDNDHHYESLNPMEQARRKLTEKFDPKQLLPVTNGFRHDDHGDDSFDSFESDIESDSEKKPESDILNAKLPDPPQQQKQVYAIMQKIKTLGSISKQEISKGFNKIRKKSMSSPKVEQKPLPGTGQQYENTTFYVNAAEIKKEERPKGKKPTRRLTTSAIELPYENHEFHSPRISSPVPSSPNGISSPPIGETTPELLSRKKSKSGRSFKSKLRKSFATESSLSIGSSTYGSSRSTFYISDSVDVDSGIFAGDSTSKLATSQELSDKPPGDRTSTTPDGRRRSTARPVAPPPPPPQDRRPRKSSSTSWYAECGVFKSEMTNGSKIKLDKGNTTSWYTEAGLYQTSGESVISSSGSSGVSTGGEGGPGEDTLHSMFLNEPLYQIYNATRLESISREMATDSDGYEEVGGQVPAEEKKPQRPTALQLVEPNRGSNRTLWSEVPEVISSGILGSLSPVERYIQEAKFEILTSEASYLKSLNLLKSHFMNHPAFRDNQILSSSDRKTLFSFIIPVQECSDRLLSDLESCWQDNIMLIGLSDSLMKNAEKYFHVYIAYCEHQGKLDRTLKRLKEAKGQFSQVLETLEADPVCCGLTIHSFLMLPMQRITRFPLLIDTVLSKLKDDDDEKANWTKVLHVIRRIASQCNEAANRCEQKFMMQQISQQIEFPGNIIPLPIVPVGVPALGTPLRTLVKKGEMTHLVWRGDEAKLTFGKKFTKTAIYAFLFTDLLVLTKKKSDESFLVFDHCARSMVTVSSGDVIPQLPTKEITSVGKHLILMTLLENYEGKTIELILSCPSETERERWLQATEPPCSENPDEKLYEQWDCPQVIAKHRYEALQPDELSLEIGDIINVFRKMVDGWYHGERVCDGTQGWFPGNFTEEVNSQHVRARNLKERYRFMTQTSNYSQTSITNGKKK